MTNAEIFIEKYKQLEEVVRSTYNLKNGDSISYYLSNQNIYQRYSDEIKYCQEVRNLLSHKKKIENEFAVEPSQQMIDFIDNLIRKIKKRTKCYEIQITKNNVCWKSMNDSVQETIKEMSDKLYTHIPILEDGKVVGVFDENSVFNYLSKQEIIMIEENTTFNDIKDYIGLHDREMEEFIFFSSQSYLEELEMEFEKAYRKGKRIGIAFMTPNGKSYEKLQGIITPWDMIAHSNRLK